MTPTSRTHVRFGLIGYGLFGKHHAAAIQRATNVELVGIAVRSESSRTVAGAEHPRVTIHEHYEELLARDDVDVIDIVVPNHLHFPMALAALKSGKHVLLEKPMALTVEQCDELLAVAEKGNRTLAIGHELRLSSLWGEARQLIERGVIGDVQYVLVELSRFPYRPGSQGWRHAAERVGSWVLEEPIHFLDLARWYLKERGEPLSIYARGNARPPGGSAEASDRGVGHATASVNTQPESSSGLYDNFSAVINFRDGAYAVVSQTLAAFGHHQTAKIVGTRGTIWAEWHATDARSEQSSHGLRHGLGAEIHECELVRPAGELIELDEEIEAMARAVLTGTAPPCTGEDGRWSVHLCLAAEQSIQTGDVVTL